MSGTPPPPLSLARLRVLDIDSTAPLPSTPLDIHTDWAIPLVHTFPKALLRLSLARAVLGDADLFAQTFIQLWNAQLFHLLSMNPGGVFHYTLLKAALSKADTHGSLIRRMASMLPSSMAPDEVFQTITFLEPLRRNVLLYRLAQNAVWPPPELQDIVRKFTKTTVIRRKDLEFIVQVPGYTLGLFPYNQDKDLEHKLVQLLKYSICDNKNENSTMPYIWLRSFDYLMPHNIEQIHSSEELKLMAGVMCEELSISHEKWLLWKSICKLDQWKQNSQDYAFLLDRLLGLYKKNCNLPLDCNTLVLALWSEYCSLFPESISIFLKEFASSDRFIFIVDRMLQSTYINSEYLLKFSKHFFVTALFNSLKDKYKQFRVLWNHVKNDNIRSEAIKVYCRDTVRGLRFDTSIPDMYMRLVKAGSKIIERLYPLENISLQEIHLIDWILRSWTQSGRLSVLSEPELCNLNLFLDYYIKCDGLEEVISLIQMQLPNVSSFSLQSKPSYSSDEVSCSLLALLDDQRPSSDIIRHNIQLLEDIDEFRLVPQVITEALSHISDKEFDTCLHSWVVLLTRTSLDFRQDLLTALSTCELSHTFLLKQLCQSSLSSNESISSILMTCSLDARNSVLNWSTTLCWKLLEESIQGKHIVATMRPDFAVTYAISSYKGPEILFECLMSFIGLTDSLEKTENFRRELLLGIDEMKNSSNINKRLESLFSLSNVKLQDVDLAICLWILSRLSEKLPEFLILPNAFPNLDFLCDRVSSNLSHCQVAAHAEKRIHLLSRSIPEINMRSCRIREISNASAAKTREVVRWIDEIKDCKAWGSVSDRCFDYDSSCLEFLRQNDQMILRRFSQVILRMRFHDNQNFMKSFVEDLVQNPHLLSQAIESDGTALWFIIRNCFDWSRNQPDSSLLERFIEMSYERIGSIAERRSNSDARHIFSVLQQLRRDNVDMHKGG